MILAIFLCAPVFMLILSFAVPSLASQPRVVLAVTFLAAGLVLSGMLAGIVSSFMKGLAGGISEGKAEKTEMSVPPPTEKEAFDEKAVQVLSILQKRGRLIDFLQEDISAYDDKQIGAAVRDIHKGCRDAITEYMQIEPVMKETEGQELIISEGFDPSAIRLTGNVIGSPPFKGALRHSGWRVVSTNLPPSPKGQDSRVIEPAEVEIP